MEHLLKYLSAVCVSSFENFAQSTDPFIDWQCCLWFKLFISLSFPTSLSPLALLSACSVCLCAIWLCVQDHGPMCACAEARRQYQMASSITLYWTKFSVFNWNGWPASPSGSICRPTHLHCGCRCMSPCLACYTGAELHGYIVTIIFSEPLPHLWSSSLALKGNLLSEPQPATIFCHAVACLFTPLIWLCSSFVILCNLMCQLLGLVSVLCSVLLGRCWRW